MLLISGITSITYMIETIFPQSLYGYIHFLMVRVRNFLNIGFHFYCPCCKSHLRTFTLINENNKLLICPSCGSHNRHRLLWIFFKVNPNLISNNIKMAKNLFLHIAPFPYFIHKLKKNKKLNYITADLNQPNVMIKVDISNTKFKSNLFDSILCIHVLEHVKEDKKAILELNRILKYKGWAIFMVPIDRKLEKTFDDPSITDPKERLKHFGQENHLRLYGTDFKENLKKGGFMVKRYLCKEILNSFEIQKYGLIRNEEIYYCRKYE